MTTANPFLTSAVAGLRQQSNQNLQNNVMPGISYGAQAAGGFGGSRQRIAQGIAAGQAETGINNAAANLYSSAYESDANRSNAMGMASMQDATNRYGIDANTNLGMGRLGLDTQVAGWNRDLGNRNADISQQGVNNQFTLGQGNLALGNRQADQSYSLGQGNLALGNRQADQSYNLGMGNLDLGRTQAANQLSLGQQANATNQYQADTSRNLGMGQLDLNRTQAQNSYDLGLRGQDLGYYQADQSYNLGMGGLQNQSQANQNNFYSTQRGQDMQQQQQSANMYQQAQQMDLMQALGLYGVGQQEMNNPLAALQQYSGVLQPYSGLNSTVSQNTPSTGGGWAGAAGGALTALQAYQMLMGGKP